MKVSELQDELRRRGMGCSGAKAVLAKRLTEALR
jgi:hypothetical protein